MHLLPIPLPGERQTALWLSDPSAQRLISIWMEENADRRSQATDLLLREDPALVMWAAALLHSWWRECPVSTAELDECTVNDAECAEDSRWTRLERLRPNWLDLVNLLAFGISRPIAARDPLPQSDSREPRLVSRSLLDRLANVSTNALRTGVLASSFVADSDPPNPTFGVTPQAFETTFLLGILSWYGEWLEICGVPADQRQLLIPEELTRAVRLIPEIERARNHLSLSSTADGDFARESEWRVPSLPSARVDRSPENEFPRRPPPLFADAPATLPKADHWTSTSCQIFEWIPKLWSSLRRLEELESDFVRQLLVAKLRAMKEFAYGASHEINNPLANIATRAQTLLRDERDPERRRQLATINSQAFRAHEMISNAMLFAHPPKLELVECDLSELLRHVRQELSEMAAAQETHFDLHIGSTDSGLFADPNQLTVAIKNVVQNSLEAVVHGGHVSVGLESTQVSGTDDHLTVCIRDDGPGIPPAVRPHMFDPFFSGREAGRGLGLGLSKAWRIITMHGGRIDCVETEEGTTFSIQLPRQQQSPAEFDAGIIDTEQPSES